MTTEGTLQANEASKQMAQVEEMMRGAGQATVPSQLAVDPVIYKGDETLPVQIKVHELRSGKYFWIYETETGEKIACLGYMLPQKLRQKLPSGKFRFTTVDPGFRPKQGTIKCMLHPDDPNRAHYDELGFRTCMKRNLKNKYQQRLHMARRHPDEWKSIEEERKERERTEDRSLQHAILKAVGPKEEDTSSLVAKPDETEAMPTAETTPLETFLCPKCGKPYKSKGKAYRRHIKNCKG
jgi:hypothetical protein